MQVVTWLCSDNYFVVARIFKKKKKGGKKPGKVNQVMANTLCVEGNFHSVGLTKEKIQPGLKDTDKYI